MYVGRRENKIFSNQKHGLIIRAICQFFSYPPSANLRGIPNPLMRAMAI